jgi:hypothetical protein
MRSCWTTSDDIVLSTKCSFPFERNKVHARKNRDYHIKGHRIEMYGSEGQASSGRCLCFSVGKLGGSGWKRHHRPKKTESVAITRIFKEQPMPSSSQKEMNGGWAEELQSLQIARRLG